jgi:hypothetical protein
MAIQLEDCDSEHHHNPTRVVRCASVYQSTQANTIELRVLLCSANNHHIQRTLSAHLYRGDHVEDPVGHAVPSMKFDLRPTLIATREGAPPAPNDHGLVQHTLFQRTMHCIERTFTQVSIWDPSDSRPFQLSVYDRRGLPQQAGHFHKKPGRTYHDPHPDTQVATTFCPPRVYPIGQPHRPSICERVNQQLGLTTV